MKLYYSPGACSVSPHIALREAGLSFQLERVDLKGKKTQTGADYLRVNPKGYVPALELDNGQVLTEGAVIVQYIADLKPEAKLAPPNGTFERVRLQEWLHFIGSELHKPYSPLYQATIPDDVKAWWRENKVVPRIDFLARSLEGKKFVMGEGFTVADGYLFTVLSWAKHVSVELGPVLQDYLRRIGQRPKVQEALKAEGLA